MQASWRLALSRTSARRRSRLGATISALLLLPCFGDSDAAERSRAVRAEFQRFNPCPANGLQRGACPGYQVDHIQPLCAGGADTRANMQWLTIRQHKDKTRLDVWLCRMSNSQGGT